jgi:hypothetical protein
MMVALFLEGGAMAVRGPSVKITKSTAEPANGLTLKKKPASSPDRREIFLATSIPDLIGVAIHPRKR